MNGDFPLVSVLMPAYNSEDTIGFALASLVSQDYLNWECIVIDDGSTDGTAKVVEFMEDDRIKLTRLPRNFGRGIARQRSLEMANGVYVTMLDSDDWMYPDKLSYQVAILEENRDVTLISMGMAITDGGDLVSVRRGFSERADVRRVVPKTSIPHAPSMIRREDIGDTRYDPKFKLAQDQDFLRRVLVGKKYMLLPKIGYCYSEMQSVTYSKIVRGYIYNAFGYLKMFKYGAGESLLLAFMEALKIPYTVLIVLFKGRRHLLGSRGTPALDSEIIEFATARCSVNAVYKRLADSGVPDGSDH